MQYKTSIALAAMAAMLAAPAMAHAEAKHATHAKKHAKAAPKAAPKVGASVEELRQAQQQISQLQAQLNALQSRLDQPAAPAPVVAQTQAVAEQAQTQAADADAKAEKALAAVAKTQTAEAKTEKAVAAMSWAGDTKISGRMYVNFSNINQSASGVKGPSTGTGFNIKRLYVGIDHKFSDVFAFNVTTDVSNVVGSTSNYDYAAPSSFGSPVGRGFYIKKAYMEAKIDPALIIRAGSADLPWVPYDEGYYGYRHIEQTIVDGPFGTSADWGVHVLGNLGDHFNYQVSVIDGAGYRNVKVTKNVDVEGRVGFNYGNVFTAVGGYVGKRGNGLEGATTYHTARRFDALAGYKNKLFTVGAEYFFAKDWGNVTSTAEDSASGATAFGSVNVTKKWSVFGEYQWVEPNRWTNASLRQHYFNFGIQFEPVKIVDIALVYKRDVVNNGNFGGVNGFYGSSYTTGVGCGTTVAKPCDGTYDEIGLFGQIRF